MNPNASDHSNKGRLWVNILQLASGTAISQIIVLLTTPVLTRYYSPHDYGVGAFFLSFLLFLAPLSTLNYYQAIILPRNEQESLRLGKICLNISLFFFAIFAAIFYLIRSDLGTTFKMPELPRIFWLFPVAIFLRSTYLVLAAYMSRYGAFGLQSKARICQTFTERMLSLVAGSAGYATSVMLVFARVISFTIEAGMLLIAFLHRSKFSADDGVTVRSPKELIREYRDFPIYSSWAMLLANGSSQLPLLLLPLLFNPEIGGYFALGNRLIQLPMQLLGESIRNAYYKEITERNHYGFENETGFQSLRNNLVMAGMPPFIFILLFGDFIFAAIFGHQWEQAGAYAGILGFYFFFQFVSTPIVCIFNAYKKQKYLLLISSLLFANNFISLFIGAYLRSPTQGFIIMSISGILIYIGMNYLAEKTVNGSHRKQFVIYVKAIVYNLPLFIVLIVLNLYNMAIVKFVILAFFLHVSCYYTLIYRNKFMKHYHIFKSIKYLYYQLKYIWQIRSF